MAQIDAMKLTKQVRMLPTSRYVSHPEVYNFLDITVAVQGNGRVNYVANSCFLECLYQIIFIGSVHNSNFMKSSFNESPLKRSALDEFGRNIQTLPVKNYISFDQINWCDHEFTQRAVGRGDF
ncbi:hypothetical protein CHELA1G11_12852 [Hyphomicrobiales bacterium]|nr:hypothetical protein CHELA1G2_11457 [Hyphomicrobiales bacterium]CAH1667573.1 hypothetical protein CHELA1G11_12852 [Hyphomicrobiales bacterium]